MTGSSEVSYFKYEFLWCGLSRWAGTLRKRQVGFWALKQNWKKLGTWWNCVSEEKTSVFYSKGGVVTKRARITIFGLVSLWVEKHLGLCPFNCLHLKPLFSYQNPVHTSSLISNISLFILPVIGCWNLPTVIKHISVKPREKQAFGHHPLLHSFLHTRAVQSTWDAEWEMLSSTPFKRSLGPYEQ